MKAYIVSSAVCPSVVLYAEDKNDALNKYAFHCGYDSLQELLQDSRYTNSMLGWSGELAIDVSQVPLPKRHHKKIHTHH